MTAQTASSPIKNAAQFELGPIWRAMVTLVGLGMTSIIVVALIRAAAGYAADYRGVIDTAVIIHLATVIPATPLGAWLLLSAKGTPLHRTLGKVWLALMVITALAAYFIRQTNGDDLSFIHIFVPITLVSAWSAYRSARAGRIAAHRAGLVRFYLLALTIPGLLSFLPNRLMAVWLFG